MTESILNANLISLIKHIARNIKFHRLAQIVGQSIVITGLDSALVEVEQHIENELGIRFKWIKPPDPVYLRRAIGKYGIIDGRGEIVGGNVSYSFRSGIPVLRDLLWKLPDDYESDEWAEFVLQDFVEQIFTDIREEIEGGSWYILLDLETNLNYPGDSKAQLAQQLKNMNHLPESFFPRSFEIKNAAIANTETIWFYNRFYL